MLNRVSDSHLSRLVFTGYTLPEIERFPLESSILGPIDVLIAGRYAPAQHGGHGLLGSANQHIHLLTNRSTLSQLACVPRRELILRPDGTMTATGLSPWRPDTCSPIGQTPIHVACEPGHPLVRARHFARWPGGDIFLVGPENPAICRWRRRGRLAVGEKLV